MILRPVLVALALWLLGGQAALAQSIGIDFGQGGSLSGSSLKLIALITGLSLAPGALLMLTCFPFMVTVLAILRQGIGLQQSPPNMLMIALALFLTWFVMEPVLTEVWANGIGPFFREELDAETAFNRTWEPLRLFMAENLDPETYIAFASLKGAEIANLPAEEAHISVLVPSFMISEISRAFEVGFLIFLPFLVIDLVTAAILMSMGMMMVPPALVSLPFKLAFFVLADGWALLAQTLVRSYGT